MTKIKKEYQKALFVVTISTIAIAIFSWMVLDYYSISERMFAVLPYFDFLKVRIIIFAPAFGIFLILKWLFREIFD